MFGRKADETQRAKRHFRVSAFPSTDPVLNLGTEQYLFSIFESEKGEELLSLYINEPAVVFGKHQNPWAEISPDVLIHGAIPVFRRFSGGGTVYHDEGNVNWSFISSRDGFSQEENLLIIAGLAAEFSGLKKTDFSLTERGDIFYLDKKISGNALAFRGDKALHHGTLLVDSNIGEIGSTLHGLSRSSLLSIEGAAVESNPAPVTSLQQAVELAGGNSDAVHAGGFMDFALEKMGCGDKNTGIPTAPEVFYDTYRDNTWHFGRTPPFRIILEGGTEVSVKQGVAQVLAAEGSGVFETGMSWDFTDREAYASFIMKLAAGPNNPD